jgi:hypothetical protein|nr:MAG TPA_asm: tail spike protein [Caudoviricetes sp.]
MVTREQLRFYCQKVLPLAYDDSLSYYEVLCKVLGKVNELVIQYDQIVQNFNVILTDYLESEDFQNLLEKFILGETPDYTYVQHYVTYLGMSDNDAAKEAVKDCPLHGTVMFPRRTVGMHETLVIDKPICLKGNYTGWIFDDSTDQISQEQFIEHSIVNTAPTAIRISVPGVKIENMAIQVANESARVRGIVIAPGETNTNKAMRYINLEHVYVWIKPGVANSTCIYMDNLFKSTFYDVSTWGGQYGFHHEGVIANGTSITFQNCWTVNYTGTGYRLEKLYYSTLQNCAADSYSGGVHGYHFKNCLGLTVQSSGAENCTAACFVAESCKGCRFDVVMVKDHQNTAASTPAGAFEVTDCDGVIIGGFHTEDETQKRHAFVKATNSLFELRGASAYGDTFVLDDGTTQAFSQDYCKVFQVDAGKLFPNDTFVESNLIVVNGILHGFLKQSTSSKRTLTAIATLSTNARIDYPGYYVVENRISITSGDTIVFDCPSCNVKQLYPIRKMS